MKDKMSKLFIALLTGGLLASCGQQMDDAKTVHAVFTAVWGESATKAAGTASGENGVNTLDILVFDTHGNLITSGRNASGATLVLEVPRGEAVCYAVGNAKSDLMGITRESDLLAVTSRLRDTGAGDFEMMSDKTPHTFVGADNVDIELKRFAVKVVLDGVELALADPSWAASGVTSIEITDIYLTNVVPFCNYAVNSMAPAADWYNKMGHAASEVESLVYESMTAGIPQGGTNTGKHYFYAYPNLTVTDVQGGSWSGRHTRLVVQANLGGSVCYYPITLPELERNHCYTIQGLVITGAGSDDPDVLDSRVPVTFTVSVTPWDSVNHDVEFL